MKQITEKSNKLKLFISYSHEDEKFIEKFENDISSLKNKVDVWRDRKIQVGENLKEEIQKNICSSDIICVFLSQNFLQSEECQKELQKAMQLKKENQSIHLCPIILSNCDWKNETELEHILALPTDAKPITTFSNENEAWNQVYKGITRIVDQELQIRKVEIKSSFFNDFLNSTEILSATHSQKTNLSLKDIFIYPQLKKYNDQKEKNELEYKDISSEDLVHELTKNKKILISGQDVSGKTTLCKKLFLELKEKHLIPIYLSKKINYQGHFKNVIEKEYEKQYKKTVDYKNINTNRVVLIIDDFHLLKNKQKIIDSLLKLKFDYQILTTDDIFTLNVSNGQYIKGYFQYQIRELDNFFRDKLIRKWLSVKNINNSTDENTFLKEVDQKTQQINDSLGKNIIYNGIMPSYPFVILSILSGLETLKKPINDKITSQGYCYEVLIYATLVKQNVTLDDIDTYLNFLTELSYAFFQSEEKINEEKYSHFLKEYEEKYFLTVPHDKIFDILSKAKLLLKDNFGYYYFNYPYIYYFFVARYISHKLSDNAIKNEVENIISNLHNDNNAYITIFLVHHSNDSFILEEILNFAKLLFNQFTPATLSKQETLFFDEQCKSIIQASLPNKPNDFNQERETQLQEIDELEKNNKKPDTNIETELSKNLRKSIRTVETMGQILKNRHGSLEKIYIKKILLEGINVHLRILSSFFGIIKHKDNQEACINYLKERIKLIAQKEGKEPTDDKLYKISEKIFWNLNFNVVQGLIHKIIHSIGSDKFFPLIDEVCDKKGTPVSQIIKQGIHMWYRKYLPIDKIAKTISNKEHSKIFKESLKHLVMNHILLHNFNYKDLQKVKQAFDLPEKTVKQITAYKNIKLKK